MMSLNRKDGLPLYIQVREDLREQIRSGALPLGRGLPLERDMAQQYGVSKITISHALRDLAKEGLITRIKRKGTFVSLRPPAAVVARRTKAIAFIVPDIEDVFITEIYRGVAAAARERGYKVFILSSDRDLEKEAENIQAMRFGAHDGAIIFPNWGRANAEQIFELKKSKFPFTLVNRHFRDIQTDYVVADNRGGGREAVEHLIRLGHRRIGCIGWIESTAVEDRLEGYRLALGRHGIPYDERLVTSILEDMKGKPFAVEPASGGYEEMKRLLRVEPRPTAVFAVSDRLAVGAMKAIREKGLSIPNDVALVGFDDLRYAADLNLTTVAQPALLTGKRATAILIGRIEGAERGVAEFEQVVLPARLVVRGTCGANKAAPASRRGRRQG